MKRCSQIIIRFSDLLISLCAIILLLPLLIVTICLLRFTGEGEIFYFQKRVGKSKRKVKVIKFATMVKNSPNIGTGTLTIKNDPRVLPVGRFLRKSKINELPQLWNVLIGDMSLIGPRPLTLDSFASYTLEGQNTISSVRPGLSGLASIVFRNEENILLGKMNPKRYYREIIAPSKEGLEIWFVENKSVSLYYRLILATVIAVIFPKIKILKFFGLNEIVYKSVSPEWFDVSK